MTEAFTEPGFNEPTSDQALQALDAVNAAILQTQQALQALEATQALAAAHGDLHPDYSIKEASGVGRYVIPRLPGWTPLLKILRDKSVDIDFSLSLYPAFDSIVADNFNGTQLFDPLDEEYESYQPLRDNLAAVRNFLLQHYFEHPPQGMSQAKVRQALEQIAEFVGDGLHNNYHFLNVVPNHNPLKPFISLSEANKPNGRGAQYIYEKILEMQRHSNWTRPFWAVVALFGGAQPFDWMVPPAHTTPFTDHFDPALLPPNAQTLPPAEQAAQLKAHLQQLEKRRAQLHQSAAFTVMAFDMDAIGNHLLYTSDHLQGVAHLSEPVRHEAVDIAREILRKLKLAIGNLNVLDGLKLKPQDDVATLGAIKGVAMVYERLLAWARGLDPLILQDPSVLAANRALGQLGYVAKVEALKLAKAAGNTALANKLSSQLHRIPSYFSEMTDPQFAHLLDKVERGINTVMNRVHEVGGPNAMLGHKPTKDISSFMAATPTAGQAQLVSSDASSDKSKQQRALIEAQETAERAQAQRIQAQVSQRLQQQGQQAQPMQRSVPARQQLRQAQQRQQQVSSSSVAPTNPQTMSPAQRAQLAQRQALIAAQAKEQEEHHHTQQVLQRIDPRVLQNIRAATNTAGMANQPIPTTNAAYQQQQRAQAQKQAQQTVQQRQGTPVKSDAAKRQEELLRQQQQQQQQQNRGRGM